MGNSSTVEQRTLTPSNPSSLAIKKHRFFLHNSADSELRNKRKSRNGWCTSAGTKVGTSRILSGSRTSEGKRPKSNPSRCNRLHGWRTNDGTKVGTSRASLSGSTTTVHDDKRQHTKPAAAALLLRSRTLRSTTPFADNLKCVLANGLGDSGPPR